MFRHLKSLVVNERGPANRINTLKLCCALLSAMFALHSRGAETPGATPGSEIDQAVVAALSRQGIKNPKVISHIDLKEPFETPTQWTFVAIQEGGPPPTQIEDDGPIVVCFVKATTPDCDQHFYGDAKNKQPWFNTPYHLDGTTTRRRALSRAGHFRAM